MPHPNRVQPDGSFAAVAARGLLMGNRGVLHDDQGRIGPALWKHRAWVCCTLSFKGRHRAVLQPRRWTELFFLDEAVALAAGHRPCAECRRADFTRYRAAWAKADGTEPSAPEMDRALHADRALPGARSLRRRPLPADRLPDGAMFAHNAAFWLVLGGAALRYDPAGYCAVQTLPLGDVDCLTPIPSLRVLEQGYRPLLHPTAAKGLETISRTGSDSAEQNKGPDRGRL